MNNLYIHEKVRDFIESLDSLLATEKNAQKEYTHSHMAMVDVQHEIELSTCYEDDLKVAVFDHMKSVARERRKHKDTIVLIDLIRKAVRDGVELEQLSRLLDDSGDKWERHYSPRCVKGLDFSDAESLRDSRLKLTVDNPQAEE